MSLFTDASIEAADDTFEKATGGYGDWDVTRLALDAAVAALDETELIEKAVKALRGVLRPLGRPQVRPGRPHRHRPTPVKPPDATRSVRHHP